MRPVEYCLALDVAPFRKQLRQRGRIFNGVSRWEWGSGDEASIKYQLYTVGTTPVLVLTYALDGQNVNQVVRFQSVRSNLNRGQYWLFLCPESGQACRRLHLFGGKFQHRKAGGGILYRQQARSISGFERVLDAYEVAEQVEAAFSKPYFREWYAGRRTRRAVRLLKKWEKVRPMLTNLALPGF